MTDDVTREAVARAIGDARWDNEWLGTPDAQLLREADAALGALAPVQPDPLRAGVEALAEEWDAADATRVLRYGWAVLALRNLLAKTGGA